VPNFVNTGTVEKEFTLEILLGPKGGSKFRSVTISIKVAVLLHEHHA